MEVYQAETAAEKFVRWVLVISVILVGVVAALWYPFGFRDIASVQFWTFSVCWFFLCVPFLLNFRVLVRRRWDSYQRKKRCLVQAENLYSSTVSAIVASNAIFIPAANSLDQFNSQWVNLLTLLPLYLIIQLTMLSGWTFRDSFHGFTYVHLVIHIVGCAIILVLQVLVGFFQESIDLQNGYAIAVLSGLVFVVALISSWGTRRLWSFVVPPMELESSKKLNRYQLFKDRIIGLLGINRCIEKRRLSSSENPDPKHKEEPPRSSDLSRFIPRVNRSEFYLDERHEIEIFWAGEKKKIELAYWNEDIDLRRKQIDEEYFHNYGGRMRKVDRRVLKQNIRDNLSFRVRNVYQVEWVRSLEMLRFKFFCALCRLVKGFSG